MGQRDTPSGRLVYLRDELGTLDRFALHRLSGANGERGPREFSVSIDNVRPTALIAWYALHDDYHENLCSVEAVGIIRSDEGFQRRFDERLDAPNEGNVLVLTSSSHGFFTKDVSGDENEEDTDIRGFTRPPGRYDEAVCPYDYPKLIIADEFRGSSMASGPECT